MSMKKKFLALALAGAVAMPVVANATGNQTVEGTSGTPFDANMDIRGSVSNKDGVAAAGKIQVELPTSLSFTVDKDGNFTSANSFTITNRSQDAIDVSVAQFTETQLNTGITILDKTKLNSSNRNQKNRANVSIVLRNGSNEVDLGEIVNNNLSTAKTLVSNLSGGGQSTNISITGLAGTKADNTTQADNTTTASLDNAGTSEDFTLKFTIKKHS